MIDNDCQLQLYIGNQTLIWGAFKVNVISHLLGVIFNNTKFFLLDQKYSNLRVAYERQKLKTSKVANFADSCVKIDVLLTEQESWNNANSLEQLLATLYDEDELDTELKLTILDAQKHLEPKLADFIVTEYQQLTTYSAKLNLYCSIIKRLHIRCDIETHKNELISAIRFRTSVVFILSIVVFFMLEQITNMPEMLGLKEGHKTDFVVSALAAGCMGSCFSMLIGMKGDINTRTLAELRAIRRVDYLLSRSLIGIVSGLLIFYAFEATILEGVLFPKLDWSNLASHEPLPESNRNHALLIFWCFLAGFSEKMVPDLLFKSEGKVNGA